MTEKPSTDEIRVSLVIWLRLNGWSMAQINRAMRGVQITDIPSHTLLEKFVRYKYAIPRPFALGILRFIDAYPAPGRFTTFEATIRANAIDKSQAKEEGVIERLEKLDRDRAAYQARCLENEHKPKPRSRSILFGLEKDVVAALSGARP